MPQPHVNGFSLALAVAAAVTAVQPSVLPAQVDPVLQKKIQVQQPQARIPIVIVLREQLDVASLDARLERTGATRAQRHRLVVEAAQEVSRRTQGALLQQLRAQERHAHVADIQPFWIMNAVAARATTEAIAQLASFPGIESIEDGDSAIELIKPVDQREAPPALPLAAPEPGLLDIRADFLWNLGFLGQGRLVANLDTGVQATHATLTTKWRGRRAGVPVSAAWHSPTLRRPTPTDTNGHGTHTMGTMCGDDGTNRIGVAPNAEWIASDSIAGSNLGQIRIDAIAAFQWCADPDANPRTVEDVPDVSSNSWGFAPAFHMVPVCDQAFWQSIDVAEAAGVVVVFAAGNEGSRGATSLRTPADRATTPLNCFSVGALNPGSATIASFSSLGPSGCPTNPIKPEVCAQGASVRSAAPGGGFATLSGTSMACPHVAGAAALLRQVDPNLSSNQVKQLLYDSAVDLGAAGEDNTYGKGRINLENAYNLLRARQGAVSVGVVSTTGRVARGRDLVWEINFANNTNQPQTVVLVLELEAVGQGVRVDLVGPVVLTIPAGFTLEPNWPAQSLNIPANLDAYYTTFPFRFRMKAIDPSNLTVISQAETDFVIT
jgi:subtilisin family serine protease